MSDMTIGTFEDFLAELLAFESGIDPRKFDWYVQSYSSPVISFPRVTSPGRVVRETTTGDCCLAWITVEEYFASLGVGDMFDARSPECLHAMQYRATNALGFIGYQFGEAILITNGYYLPERVVSYYGDVEREYESYYFGSVENSTWRGGQLEALYRIPGTDKEIMATDVNRWRGTFTGKNGIGSFEDLKTPEKQEFLIRSILASNYKLLKEQLSLQGETLQHVLEHTRVVHTNEYGCRMEYKASLSGLLAAAHLCGVFATVKFLMSGIYARDEFGTSLSKYLANFAHYDTPFASGSEIPAND